MKAHLHSLEMQFYVDDVFLICFAKSCIILEIPSDGKLHGLFPNGNKEVGMPVAALKREERVITLIGWFSNIPGHVNPGMYMHSALPAVVVTAL